MATLKDIADRAGISVGTVDRIMHNRGRFSEETAARVRKIARDLDYRPNLMARQLSRSAECRLALFMPEPEQDSAYWSLPLAGARWAAEEYSAFGVSLETIFYDRYSSESYRRAGERLAAGKWDGIMMAPLRGGETLELMETIGPEIPVIFFDTDLPSAPRMGFIGQDSRAGGRLAARLLKMAAGERLPDPEYLILAPNADNEHLDHRIRGFEEAIAARVETCVVNVESDHDTDAYRRALDRHIGEETAGVFVIDASSHFVAEYLAQKESDGMRHLPLVGFDLVPENRPWLETGIIDFLLTQRPVEQGAEGIRRLFRKVFEGESGPEQEYTPIDIVTRENLQYIIKEDAS